MWRAVRRLTLLDRARQALGGSAKLADVLGIGRRAVTHKLVADRGLTDAELHTVADALDTQAASTAALAAAIREVAGTTIEAPSAAAREYADALRVAEALGASDRFGRALASVCAGSTRDPVS